MHQLSVFVSFAYTLVYR